MPLLRPQVEHALAGSQNHDTPAHSQHVAKVSNGELGMVVGHGVFVDLVVLVAPKDARRDSALNRGKEFLSSPDQAMLGRSGARAPSIGSSARYASISSRQTKDTTRHHRATRANFASFSGPRHWNNGGPPWCAGGRRRGLGTGRLHKRRGIEGATRRERARTAVSLLCLLTQGARWGVG